MCHFDSNKKLKIQFQNSIWDCDKVESNSSYHLIFPLLWTGGEHPREHVDWTWLRTRTPEYWRWWRLGRRALSRECRTSSSREVQRNQLFVLLSYSQHWNRLTVDICKCHLKSFSCFKCICLQNYWVIYSTLYWRCQWQNYFFFQTFDCCSPGAAPPRVGMLPETSIFIKIFRTQVSNTRILKYINCAKIIARITFKKWVVLTQVELMRMRTINPE